MANQKSSTPTSKAAAVNIAPIPEHLANRGIADHADDIDCAIISVRDLLKLALQELIDHRVYSIGCKAESAIRAAGRYIDDIEATNQNFHELALNGGGNAKQ